MFANKKFNQDQISIIIQIHNRLRSKVVNGEAKGSNGELPSAIDMLQEYFDKK